MRLYRCSLGLLVGAVPQGPQTTETIAQSEH